MFSWEYNEIFKNTSFEDYLRTAASEWCHVKDLAKTRSENVVRCWSAPFFYKQRFFSTQPQCCFTFSWIELQMLLRCCLRHKSIIIPRHFLCLLYLSPCLELDLFMLYLCDLFFIFTFNFITINHTGIHVWYFLEYVLLFLDDNMDEECW